MHPVVWYYRVIKGYIMAMTKVALALPEQMLMALALIEKDTDRPRTRIIRRAVSDYLRVYAQTHPDFLDRVGVPLIVEKEFKPGLKTDIISIRGQKHTVVITDGGWRQPVPDDYIEINTTLLSVLDKEDE